MRRLKNAKGFTLVELLVVVVIIGILAAIALPNFIGAQVKAKNAGVKGNMRTAQLAAESYATDAGGTYGPTAASIAPYAPGGTNTVGGAAGQWPKNPAATATAGIVEGTALANAAAVTAARAGALGTGTAGTGAYAGTTAADSYAVVGYGCDAAGTQLSDTSGTAPLIMSNQ